MACFLVPEPAREEFVSACFRVISGSGGCFASSENLPSEEPPSPSKALLRRETYFDHLPGSHVNHAYEAFSSQAGLMLVTRKKKRAFTKASLERLRGTTSQKWIENTRGMQHEGFVS